MRLGSAPAPRQGRPCSSLSRCFTIGSACTQPWATALRLRRGPAWRPSPCALRRDILIYPLHTKGGGPKLTIQRKEKKEPLEVKLTRETIRIRPVRARTEGGDIGYLRISQFNEQTYEALRTALKTIAGEVGPDKLKGYVIDLRNNPGACSI